MNQANRASDSTQGGVVATRYTILPKTIFPLNNNNYNNKQTKHIKRFLNT